MNFRLKIWRQKGRTIQGSFKEYVIDNISGDTSFLEMLDILNNKIIHEGNDEPVAFDSDCREGICGMCGVVIDGLAHGPLKGTTTCQLHMRHFKDGACITIEPWRATSFPIVKDLVVDRSSFDRIIESGGYISINTGGAPDANAIPISKTIADFSMDAAQCIGCGACVASCKNASAMLFVGAKVSHLSSLPQGKIERTARVQNMVTTMDSLKFGNCTNEGECEAACPKEISIKHIAKLNQEYYKSFFSF